MSYGYKVDATIAVVGCGGTGGFLAEAISRLLLGRKASLYLIDMDMVEPHNVARQAFDESDVGRFKSEVLAERLARRFWREISYSVRPYDAALHCSIFQQPARLKLVVGCVDNAAARRSIADSIGARLESWRSNSGDVWWLDTGNGENSGQVLLGNQTDPDRLKRAFHPPTGSCFALPAPSLQRPDLLAAPPAPEPRQELDCAERVAADEQGPTVNQMVAAYAATFVHKLLTDKANWAGCYFDADAGSLSCIPADPKSIAPMVGKTAAFLTDRRVRDGGTEGRSF